MSTNRDMERAVGRRYPRSMRHLQQLIMDSEACAKSYGKTSWLGKDKFAPAFQKFQSTLATCAISMAEDGAIDDVYDGAEVIRSIDTAMGLLQCTYSSWPLAFQFWEVFCSGRKF